ncbi:MAG: ATP-dependent sacrificial sulfur transferase LarE [Gemmatimonadaceae bacterium]
MTTTRSTAPVPLPTAKERELKAWLVARRTVLVGYSGGVDSAFLACVAREELGRDGVLAVVGRSAAYPEQQWEHARSVARQFDIPLLEVPTDELQDARYAANPTNRCYHCKTVLWQTLVPIAAARGLAVIIDGTNADDLADYRPGHRAAQERGVRSPLAELGFSKADIRALSQRHGIPGWANPSSPCLASRLPYGFAVTAERLAQVERAEAALRALGISGNLRVRHHGDLARVELDATELREWLLPEPRRTLRHALLASGFERVALDLRGFRSGSLNVLSGVAGS